MLDEFARNGVGYGNESIHIACLVSSKQQLQELRQELNASDLFAGSSALTDHVSLSLAFGKVTRELPRGQPSVVGAHWRSQPKAEAAGGAPRRGVTLILRRFRFRQTQEYENGPVERLHVFGGQ